MPDYEGMGCDQWREALSAQLDGEETTTERNDIDAHLDMCADCRHWLDRAATVTRLARTSLVTSTPDLADAILAATPALAPAPEVAASEPRPSAFADRLILVLRAALGVLGAVQLVLGLAQIGGGVAGTHTHASAGLTATPGHLWHESAAWNVAIGAGFLFIAVRRTRPTGLLPTLTVFVAMLVLLSVNDLVAAMVEPARLVSHGFVLAGYLIIVALSRPALDPGQPPTGQLPGRSAWRVRFADTETDIEPETPARLRLVRPSPATGLAADRVAPYRPATGVTAVDDGADRRVGRPHPGAPLPAQRHAGKRNAA